MTLAGPIEEATKELHTLLLSIPLNMAADGETRKITMDLRLDARRAVAKVARAIGVLPKKQKMEHIYALSKLVVSEHLDTNSCVYILQTLYVACKITPQDMHAYKIDRATAPSQAAISIRRV